MGTRLLIILLFLTAACAASGNAQVYYDPDILALLGRHGCSDCHGGSGGLNVTPYSSIMTTGNHGPVVVPGDTNSVIVLKLKGTAGFGGRMPTGGPFLTGEEIQVFVQWIQGGALESAATSVDNQANGPSEFKLSQNYPNPFNPATNIRFRTGEAGNVRLAVYDHLGREVAVLVDALMDAGEFEARFDASGLASGVYIYRLRVTPLASAAPGGSAASASTFAMTGKMLLMK